MASFELLTQIRNEAAERPQHNIMLLVSIELQLSLCKHLRRNLWGVNNNSRWSHGDRKKCNREVENENTQRLKVDVAFSGQNLIICISNLARNLGALTYFCSDLP